MTNYTDLPVSTDIDELSRRRAAHVPGPFDLDVVNDPRDGALRTVFAEPLPVDFEKLDWSVDYNRLQPRIYVSFGQLVCHTGLTALQAIDLANALLSGAQAILRRGN